jgi:thioesterase domain-containing protein/acyl carrier protein
VRSHPGNSIDGEVARFDVLVMNEAGEILLEAEEFMLRKLERLGRSGDASGVGATGSPEPASEAERQFLESYESGMLVEEGLQVLMRVLASQPPSQLVVSSIETPRLIERGRAVQAAESTGVRFARPNLASEYEAPRDAIERALVSYFEGLLGLEEVGIHDDFFELGGHSLIAVRLFSRIKKTYGVEYPLSILFEAPTVAQCGELLKRDGGEDGARDSGLRAATPRHQFLVPLHAVSDPGKRPFFLVSGMLGNVLNLRHLAGLLSEDQPVYAIQARGLYGDDRPHTRFEEMAADYIEEIRSVQPSGPYYLGGFSGGGITALEMAQQLMRSGEEIGILVMLDTPGGGAHLSPRDRLEIQWLKLRKEGWKYPVSFTRNRWAWEKQRLRSLLPSEEEKLSPAVFRSAQIEQAFREAVAHYRPESYPGKITLFRPPLDEAYVLSGGRVVSRQRVFVRHDNHWEAYAQGGVEVHVVPGSHNGMVLEPYVRVLGAELRRCLEEAQSSASMTL